MRESRFSVSDNTVEWKMVLPRVLGKSIKKLTFSFWPNHNNDLLQPQLSCTSPL